MKHVRLCTDARTYEPLSCDGRPCRAGEAAYRLQQVCAPSPPFSPPPPSPAAAAAATGRVIPPSQSGSWPGGERVPRALRLAPPASYLYLLVLTVAGSSFVVSSAWCGGRHVHSAEVMENRTRVKRNVFDKGF